VVGTTSNSSSRSRRSSISSQWPSWVEGTQHGHGGAGICNRSWDEWRAAGHDTASMIADPQFQFEQGVTAVGGIESSRGGSAHGQHGQHGQHGRYEQHEHQPALPPISPADFVLAPTSPALVLGFDPLLMTAVVGTVGPSAAARFDWQHQCASSSAADSSSGGGAGLGGGTGAASPYQCGPPGVPANGTVSGSGVWACGDVAVWHCSEGYVLTGATFAYCRGGSSAHSGTHSGTHNGWSSPPPTCVPLPVPTCLQTGSATVPDRLTAGPASRHSILHAAAGGFFITQQEDSNLCVYKGSGPTDNKGEVWCSGGGAHPTLAFATVLQTDGNLCTYPPAAVHLESRSKEPQTDPTTALTTEVWSPSAQESSSVWCSGSPVCKEKPCQLWAALGDDGRFCVYHNDDGAPCQTKSRSSATNPPVWCSPGPGEASAP
jgi:hypothetical protein